MKLFILSSLYFISTSVFSQRTTNEIRIPVVFHVLHTSENENIPTPRILAELRDLQNDFLMLNSDTNNVSPLFRSRIANPNIKFELADTILSERGIVRIEVNSNKRKLHKKSSIINPERFMNVYIGNLSGDGYTYCSPGNDYDAIFVNYRWVGGRFRLLTHEAGHWLNLYHTFENGCKGNGDEVDDTPGQPSITGLENCLTDQTALGCNGQTYNYNNFMDYSRCRFMFTRGQVIRMRTFINQSRAGLLSN